MRSLSYITEKTLINAMKHTVTEDYAYLELDWGNRTNLFILLFIGEKILDSWIFLSDEIALTEIRKAGVRKWKSFMLVYSRNILSRPHQINKERSVRNFGKTAEIE